MLFNLSEVIHVLCCCTATHCLLLVYTCVSFEYLQGAKSLQHMKLLFVILYFEGLYQKFLC